ncbi:phosphosulfolactate synthase [Lihuaxuella thermophila]|uniref:Phosphosulfolactate synthase n=1 Tax=Lihuaxuella thermophila TaxID=1173111 RepID=A0A1H8EUI3_9BACL|nr:phosphosulfolactate synthase [Lihuaxuella thermophila]SEN23040.1 phosphosulfolactate synthase [Lihuaxuella thermophila]
MESTSTMIWNRKLIDPSKERMEKPRTRGCTMVMDKGTGLIAFRDTLELAGAYIDFIKLGFGTAVLTPGAVLREKIILCKQHQVNLYPGGTFFEIAVAQNCLHSYFRTLKELQFEWVEISDGTIDLSRQDREKAIREAIEWGFRVITEVGKKTAGSVATIPELLSTYEHDVKAGAIYIIVEGRENGQNIGIYDDRGEVNSRYVMDVLKEVDPDRIIWETPQKHQQIQILQLVGCNANLGNIPVHEILSVESLRRGLRSDTFCFWNR